MQTRIVLASNSHDVGRAAVARSAEKDSVVLGGKGRCRQGQRGKEAVEAATARSR